MPDKSLTYSVKLDLASAQAQAQQLRALFQQSLQNIQVNPGDPSAFKNALATDTAATRAAAQERIQIAKAETAERTQAAKLAASAGIEEEKRVTAAFKAEIQQQNLAQRQAQQASQQKTQSPIGGGQSDAFGGLGNALAGYLTIQGVRQVAQQTMAFAQYGAEIRRTEASFRILSGSASEASARIASIKAAGGGAIDTLQAMQLADQAVSLNLAKTSQDFGNLVRAGREVALVSPVIHDVQSAVSELGLASANLSFRRLDQLGLSASEVKSKMKELQAANAGLDDSQAFLAASIETLNAKYGTLLDTTEAQATGVERLKVAISDLWAEIAKGPAGKSVDNVFAGLANSLNEGLAYAGTKDNSVISKAFDDVMAKAKANAEDFKNIPLLGSSASGQLAGMEAFKKVFDQVNAGVAAGIPIAAEYQKQIDEIAISVIRKNQISDEELQKVHEIQTGYASAAVAQRAQLAAQQATTQQSAIQKAQQERVAGLLEPINKLGNNLKDVGLDNFFLSLQDGLSKSAELTANETNKVAELRQQLVGIGQAVAESNGVISPDQRQRVAAIKAEIDALAEAAKLNKELQQVKPVAGQDLEGIYTRLNAIIAQAGNTMTEVADKARAMGNAIAESGQASPVDLGMIDAMAAQVNQADFSQLTQAMNELNQGSLDAVPGVDALRSKLAEYYDTLASGKGLSADEAADMNMLMSQADALGGSTSALAGIQSELGYKFLESHDYAASLVEQIANLDALYGAGQIGADQFSGAMGVLTSELYRQLDAAGVLTPALRELLALQSAVAGSRVAPGQAGGGIYTGGPGERKPGLSPGFVSGQRQAEAAEALARSKADTTARDEMRKANDRAARGAQSAFENAASATQKAFKDVTDKIISALEKVPGLFKTSDVTQGDMDKAAAGGSVNFADDFVRRFANVAEGKKNIGVSADQVRDALARIGVQGSNDNKALLAQLKEHWNDSSLFSNKENLKLINADAVKDATKLQGQANEGKQNILDYFGATIDAVKEKFKAGDPDIVAAVADDLAGSNDKNIKAMGDQLKAGGQQIIDKVLALAQASIDKTVGSLGSGAAGGAAGITVPTISVGAPTGKAGTTGGTGGFLDGTAFAGGTVPMTGEITNIVLGPNAAQNFAEDLGTQFSENSSAFTAIGASINTLISRGLSTVGKSADGAATSSLTTVAQNFAEDLGIQFSASAGAFTGLGAGIDVLIQSGFINVKRGNEMATAFTSALSAQFGSTDNAPTYGAMGDTISYLIESGFIDRKERLDMATAFINSLNNQFGAKGGKGEASKLDALKNTGQSLSLMVESGFVNREDRLDMAGAFSAALSTQFSTVSTNYGAIGDSVSYLIESGVANRKAEDRLDMAGPFMAALSQQFSQQDFSGITTQIQNALNGASLDKETEGADGKIRRKPAMDFSSTASQITGSLSKAMGGQADFLKTIGDNASTFIGFGMTDHDFSATAGALISSMTTSFTTEQARTQLIAAGAALSGAVFAGFQQSLPYSPWLSSIVAEVVSQAATSLNSSLQDSLKPQALGF